ncbi:MAG: hypothetical protein LUG87_00815 [Oscillospiraceae bacterium]|nr:hypothetical protein [Oscillospiraceae bacterium]
MNAALVVMAAGLGSHYGGVKQIERLGPDGEILMEYAIYDALRAGFDKLVLIIKPEMLEDVKAVFGDRVEQATGLKICYAFQTLTDDYKGVAIPKARTKPLGTVHAILAAADYLDRPFAAINANDYYGANAVAAIGGALPCLRSGGDAAMVAYQLKNTVSPFGTVTRGVCGVADGALQTVTETYKIRLFPDGTIRDTSGGEDGPLLAPDTLVSMNMWGYHPDIIPLLEARFLQFLQTLAPDDNSSECLLPVVMDEFIAQGAARCAVLHTDDHWFGLTYQEDKESVRTALQALHASGVYPPALWK